MTEPYYVDELTVIYHGDCRVLLPQIIARPGVDVVLTDPPYDGRTHAGARTSEFETRQREAEGGELRPCGQIAIGFAALSDVVFPARLRYFARRWCVVFCSLEQLGAYQEIAGDDYVRGGVWQRYGAPQFSGDRPAQAAEGVAILHRPGRKRWNGGGAFAFWQSEQVSDLERVHPTQKPIGLMTQLVQAFSEVGETILDPYMGSGTTLVASRRLGRRSIGIESDLGHCAAAVSRLAQPVLPMFDELSLEHDNVLRNRLLPF